MTEIFAHGVGFATDSADYAANDMELVENTPKEIRDLVIEMADRLEGKWRKEKEDEELHRRFWKLFPRSAIVGIPPRPLHGKIRARYGAKYLPTNRWWLR
jgi:transcription termination factor Rho